jgi:hypothetical protein
MIWKYCNIKRILFVVLNEAITGVAVATDNTFNLNPALNVRRTFCKASDRDVQANTAILTEIVKHWH